VRDFSRTRLARVAGRTRTVVARVGSRVCGRRTCGSSDMWRGIRPTDGGATFGMSAGGGGDRARVRVNMYIYTCVCVCDACVTYAACVYVY